MNKKINAIAMCIVLLSLAACKKENDNSNYNPVGFWRGNAYNVVHTVMVVYPDGKANIYTRVMGRDTASAVVKGYGAYTFSGNTIDAYGVFGSNDTVYLQATLQSNDQMTGQIYFTTASDLVECKLKRE